MREPGESGLTRAEESFIRSVNHLGNVAVWYVNRRVSSLRGVLRGSRSPTLDGFEQALVEAQGMEGLPSPERVVEMVRGHANELKMAKEIRKGNRVVINGQRCKVLSVMFAPNELQATHQELTMVPVSKHEEIDGREFKAIVENNHEIRKIW
jgi:hypothetical protein